METATKTTIEVRIIESLRDSIGRPSDSVYIFPGPDDNTCLILADREWADQHRSKLEEVKGYCDFAFNFPARPAEIQVFVSSQKAKTLVEAMM